MKIKGEKNVKINIICIGKLKEKYLIDAINEYSKRIKRFCDFKITELPDEKIPDNPSDAEIEKILRTEAGKIEKYLSDTDCIISLCVEGDKLSSEGFAKKISDFMLSGKSSIVFIIGGSLGLCESIKKRSALRLSFSDMTFPHQLMRVILSEQIYRAFKINANEKYHK